MFNAPYSNTRSVVELVIGEIIALARRLPEKTQRMHDGVWDKSARGSHEVRGRTLGIVGYDPLRCYSNRRTMAVARWSGKDPSSEVTGIWGSGQSPIEPVLVLTGCRTALG